MILTSSAKYYFEFQPKIHVNINVYIPYVNYCPNNYGSKLKEKTLYFDSSPA